MWAEIDARPRGEIAPWQRVGGLPLIVRQLRLLGRLGWTGAEVVVPDGEARQRIEAAIARHPQPPGLVVEIVAPGGRSRPGAVSLRAAAIYHRDALAAAGTTGAPPRPVLEVERRADLPRARAALIAGIRKSAAIDGNFCYWVLRPMARPLLRLLMESPVTPNQVTLTALACGLTAAGLAATGDARLTAFAGLFYFLSGFFDILDGDLARVKLTSSKLGEWLDSMCDEAATYSLACGLGIGLWRGGGDPIWALIGGGAALLGVLAVGPLYLELHRRGLHIDTAQFPWFFQTGLGVTAKPTGIGHVINALGALVRRDINVTVSALLLAVGLGWVALLGILAGVTIGFFVTTAHFVVMASRRSAAG
jgi:hypothetical protein